MACRDPHFIQKREICVIIRIEDIKNGINSNLPIEEAVVKLIKKANSRGGTDNISIAYLKKESGEL